MEGVNRRFRLIAALGMALVLATFTIYIAIKGGDVQEPLLQASELTAKRQLATSQTVQVDGIAAGPIKGEQGERFSFYVTDRKGGNKTLVDYRGSVPDAFRVGRNVIITGKLVDGTFVAEPNSLVTKCPSKFESEGGSSRSGS
ncbi:MAG: cytochrome c maturation protein CcmE [Thermoleophilia bacterium]|jgi:cytochrome c-type biogenesis protein CcmE|nr:cytochrome c maturation protein CcmE [Thermoleophilia bacterium]